MSLGGGEDPVSEGDGEGVEGGRLLAIERRSRPAAKGLASHGWTDHQAAVFADLCRTAGFTAVRVETHAPGRGALLAVQARR